MPLTSDLMKTLLALLLTIAAATSTTKIPAETGTGKAGPTSVELADLLHTETVIIENLRNYVNALDNKISAIKKKTKEIRSIYDVALNDTGKYFGNPINTFNLIKRVTYEWVAIRNLAGEDVTGHIVENITEFSEILAFPTEGDLDEAVGRLLKIQDVYQMETSQVAMGEFNGMKFGSQMTWSDCLAIGEQSFKQGEHLVAKVWLQTALEKLPSNAGNPQADKARAEIMETMANSEYQSGNIKEAIGITARILELDPKNKRAIAAQATFREKLKKTSMKTRRMKPKKSTDELLVEELCRGTSEQYTSSSFRRTCTFIDGNIPFLRIAPVKLETVSADPFIAIYHSIFGETEIEILKNFLKDNEGGKKVSMKFGERLERVTGHKVNTFGNWTSIRNHFYDKIDFRANGVSEEKERSVGVVWIQLNEPKLGGSIVFPQLEVGVDVSKGSVLYWSTRDEFNELDYRTKEFTCPVIAGTLEAATTLVHLGKIASK